MGVYRGSVRAVNGEMCVHSEQESNPDYTAHVGQQTHLCTVCSHRPPACAQGHQHVLTDHERALTQTTSVRSDDQHALTDHQRAPIQITSVPPNLDG